MTQKKYSSSLSRQSSETKPNAELVLVSQEPLLYLEFNQPNKQNVYEINLFKHWTFLSLKIIVDTVIVWNETSKHFLKSVKKTHNLAFRCECSSPYQGTAAGKV